MKISSGQTNLKQTSVVLRSINVTMIKYICILGFIISFTGCGDSDDDCNQSFGTPFKVEVGETYCLPDGSELFIDSITDSYCPCNADCIWQGEALIEAARVTQSDLVETLLIHEVLVDENPEGIRISSIATTKSCNPDIVQIEIVIDQ